MSTSQWLPHTFRMRCIRSPVHTLRGRRHDPRYSQPRGLYMARGTPGDGGSMFRVGMELRLQAASGRVESWGGAAGFPRAGAQDRMCQSHADVLSSGDRPAMACDACREYVLFRCWVTRTLSRQSRPIQLRIGLEILQASTKRPSALSSIRSRGLRAFRISACMPSSPLTTRSSVDKALSIRPGYRYHRRGSAWQQVRH